RRMYLRSRTCQWIVAVVLLASGVAAVAFLRFVQGPAMIALLPLVFSFVQTAFSPILRLLGVYRYHSPMLKVTIRSRRIYEIHGGTMFDYLIHLRWKDQGAAAARWILVSYLQGLSDIADCVERGELPPAIRITGTSYFFRDASARRLGFALEQPGLRLRANL